MDCQQIRFGRCKSVGHKEADCYVIVGRPRLKPDIWKGDRNRKRKCRHWNNDEFEDTNEGSRYISQRRELLLSDNLTSNTLLITDDGIKLADWVYL